LRGAVAIRHLRPIVGVALLAVLPSGCRARQVAAGLSSASSITVGAPTFRATQIRDLDVPVSAGRMVIETPPFAEAGFAAIDVSVAVDRALAGTIPDPDPTRVVFAELGGTVLAEGQLRKTGDASFPYGVVRTVVAKAPYAIVLEGLDKYVGKATIHVAQDTSGA
jgi:hypothetical protein